MSSKHVTTQTWSCCTVVNVGELLSLSGPQLPQVRVSPLLDCLGSSGMPLLGLDQTGAT